MTMEVTKGHAQLKPNHPKHPQALRDVAHAEVLKTAMASKSCL